MDANPEPVMTFGSLDEAESALDWIGLDFVEREGAFEGLLTSEDRELLDGVQADPETPQPVRDLAVVLGRLLDATGPDAEVAWRVAFDV